MSLWPKVGEMRFGCGMSFWPFWWRLSFSPENDLCQQGFSWHIGPFCLWANWKE